MNARALCLSDRGFHLDLQEHMHCVLVYVH